MKNGCVVLFLSRRRKPITYFATVAVIRALIEARMNCGTLLNIGSIAFASSLRGNP
jgi:hypothetical protein